MAADFQVAHPAQGRLMVVAPSTSLVSMWLVIILVVLFFVIFYTTSRTVRRVLTASKTPAEVSSAVLRYRLLGVAILAGFLGLFWLVSYNSGSIVLDRTTNTATLRVKMTFLLPARSQTTRLDNVERAILDYKPNARRIRLLAHHGHDLAYPIWTSRPGQLEAVDAINTFLGDGHADEP